MSYAGHLGYVPVQLIQHCQNNHLENTLRVYLALKYWSGDGSVTYNKEMLVHYSRELSVSERTIRNQIKRLQKLKWVSIDKHMTLFIRSFKWLERDVEHRFRSRVELTWKDLKKDSFKPYLMGAVIGYFVKVQRTKEYLEGRKKARSLHLKYTPFPLSYSHLNKLTNKSHSELDKLIKKAVKLRFIVKEQNMERLYISKEELNELRKQGYEGVGFPVWKKGKAYLQHSNNFLELLHYKKIKKSKR